MRQMRRHAGARRPARWLARRADARQQFSRAQRRGDRRAKCVAQIGVEPGVGALIGLTESAARQMLQRGLSLGGVGAGILQHSERRRIALAGLV